MLTPLDYLAAQLRASSPSSDWGAHGVDRAQELAAMFQRFGLTDLSTLILQRVDIWESFALVGREFDPRSQAEYDRMPAVADLSLHSGEHQGVSPDPNFSFMHYLTMTDPVNGWYDYMGRKKDPLTVLESRDFLPLRFIVNGAPVGFLGDTNRDGSMSGGSPLLKVWQGAILVAWSSRGAGHVHYLLLLTPEREFRFHPVWQSSSAGDRAALREVVSVAIAFGSMAYAFAGTGSIAAQLGEKIVGSQFAASYPSITSAIGNAAIGTAMNGGDVEAAVKTAAINAGASSLGVMVGQQVAGVTDIDTLGRVAQAATTAYIRGGDVDAAVSFALLQSIPDAFPSAIQPEIPTVDFFNSAAALDFQPLPDPWGVSALPGVAAPEFTPLPSVLDFMPVSLPADTGAGGGSIWQDARNWAGDTFTRENVRAVRDVVTDVASIVRTVRAIDDPAAPMPAPGQRAAVQNPVQTIRNPDGSITRVAPDGTFQVIPASQVQAAMNQASGFSINPQMLAIGGAAALALLLLMRRR